MRKCVDCGTSLPDGSSPKRLYCNDCKKAKTRAYDVQRNRARRGNVPTIVPCAACGTPVNRGHVGPAFRYCEPCREQRRREHYTAMNHRKRGKPVTEFTCIDCGRTFPRTSQKVPKRCEECRPKHEATLRKRLYDANPEKFRQRAREVAARLQGEEREAYLARKSEANRQRYAANPEAGRLRAIKAKYGLPIDTYLRMIEDTGPSCPICFTEFTASGKHKRCVDHDHATGDIRGIICAACNMSIGLFLDNPSTVLRAIKYLEAHS